MAFSDGLNKIWEDWNIRGAVLFSLTMQIILIFLAPFRKLSANRIVTLLVWSAYLLADAIATSAVGLIVKTQRYDDSPVLRTSEDFLAFWVPFLLLHLGGPDTITAFALEDNQLWVRHLLALITQGIATGYLFLQTFSHNRFRVPTLLLFIVGITKYMERTCSLFLASRDRFRNSMIRKPKAGGVNFSKSGQNVAGAKAAEPRESKSGPETSSADPLTESDPKELSDVEVVAKGHELFKIFKGLLVDLVFGFKERDESRQFFSSTTPQLAFRIIEVELNFMYEVLYTKAAVVHSLLGACFRLVASGLVIAALVIFHFLINKQGFNKIDVGVTYALLLGAICLDGLAFSISAFSNWTLVHFFNRASQEDSSLVSRFYKGVLPVYKGLLDFKRPRVYVSETDKHTALVTPIVFRKWSEKVPCFNMVTYCLKGSSIRIHRRMSPASSHRITSPIHPSNGEVSRGKIKASQNLVDLHKKANYFLGVAKAVKYWIFFKKNLIHLIRLTEILDELTYVTEEPLTQELWQFIFDELKEKSSSIKPGQEAPKALFSARGDGVVAGEKGDKEENHTATGKKGIDLKDYLGKVSYDESLLLWHVATGILYHAEDLTNPEDGDRREFSKIIADYMLYVLIWRPTMMSAIAGIAKLRYEDTYIDARRLFKRRGMRPGKVKSACKMVLDRIDPKSVPTEIMKENESLSVLFKANELAHGLRGLGDKKWEIVSKVWVELLAYGASHCGATAHAQQLSRGGDLITFVWLLMGHFGLLDQFQPNSCLSSPGEDQPATGVGYSFFKLIPA